MPDLRRSTRAHAALVVTGAVALASASTLVYAAVARRDTTRLRLTTAPVSRTVAPGQTARFALRVRRTHFTGSVRVRVLGTVPSGVTTTLSFGRRRSCAVTRRYRHRVCWYPTGTRQTRVDLTVRTTSRMRTGTYRLRLQAVRRGGRPTAQLSVFLVVRTPTSGVVGGQGEPTPAPSPGGTTAPPSSAPPPASAATVPSGSGGDEGEPFPIHGDVSDLAPGVTRPIDLELSNDQDDARLVTALGVALGAVTAPNADLEHPCSTADFQVAQMPADAFPIVLPPGTHRLSELGVAVQRWPSLTMLSRPINQDGCQQASQQLVFTGQTAEAP